MQYPILSEYVRAIQNSEDNLDKLRDLKPVLDSYGEPRRSSGAFAVVFKMKDEQTGKCYALKCFTEEQDGREEAYRMIADELENMDSTYLTSVEYLDKELFVDSDCEQDEFPVLKMDWVEGVTMEQYIADHYRDSESMSMLCYRFCKLAVWLRSQPFAHGDLKPDNIIVREDGTLTLVDYDGMFVPAMKGQKSPTMGTKDFSHPLRTVDDFDETIDDFALSVIALSLKAITLRPSLLDEYGASDRLLFSAADYLNLSSCKVLPALQKLMTDAEFNTFYSLFLLAYAKKNLAMVSFRLFSVRKPEMNKPSHVSQPIVEELSTEVTDEDLKNAIEDEFGVKYSRDGKRLLDTSCDLIGKYEIRKGTKVVCDFAFSDCDSLTEIQIPKSVTTIGDSAFENCFGLKSLIIPSSVREIKGNPFIGLQCVIENQSEVFLLEDGILYDRQRTKLIANLNHKRERIVIPLGVTTIGNSAFSAFYGSSLTEIQIPQSVTTIGDSAFFYCSRLKSLIIPSSVREIKGNPFIGLQCVIENQSEVFLLEDGILYDKQRTKLIANLNYGRKYLVIPLGVTTIGDSAFSDCSRLTKIQIPKSVTTIGNHAFSSCSSLTEILIPKSVTTIGDYAFSYCSSLTEILIPKSVTNIGDYAFYDCSSLTEMLIPKSVTNIGDYAFYGCYNLTKIQIPQSVTTIGDSAFFACSSLTEILIPKSVINIGDYAFSYCSRLTKIQIPQSVTTIGDHAFSSCSRLTEILIPQSVMTIGVSAFSYCPRLTKIQIPQSVTTIGDSAFSYCSRLTEIQIPQSVTTIGDSTFKDCSDLTEIQIPQSVTTIGDYAFDGCSSLTEIQIPQSVTTIGDFAFCGCNLSQATKDKLTKRFGGK